ncbi:MAG: aspartate aminotransferase family protein [Candidatus Dormibacteria bacterium]
MTVDEVQRVDRVVPGGCFGYTRLPPDLTFVAVRGNGSHLWAQDGREFIDYTLGSGPLIVGHAHPRVVEAITEQARLGTHFYAMNEQAIRLAERITSAIPGVEAVKFCSDGSEATFFAIRCARAFTGRSVIVRFEGAYHGYHDYALPGYPGRPGGYGRVGTRYEGVPAAVADTVVVAPFNDLAATEQLVGACGEDVAAVIVEPIQRAIMPAAGFLGGLRQLCDRIGALLIFDEVVTGFRTEGGSAQVAYGVTPDLTALGKAIGGGLPLAAIVGRREIVALTVPSVESSEQRVFMSGTLNGNPLGAAAGLATLGVVDEVGGIEKMAGYGRSLAAGILKLSQRYDQPMKILGPGPFFEVVFGDREVTDYASYARTNRRMAVEFGLAMMRRGMYAVPGAKWYFSTEHTGEDLERTLVAVDECLAELVKGGAP